MNWIRLFAISRRESHRFLKVWTQTLLSPIVIAIMYFAAFGTVLSSQTPEIQGVSYFLFVLPGIILLQSTSNAFQNSSSSLIIAKYQGNISTLLVTPLSAIEKTLGYLIGGVFRGFLVAVVIFAISLLFIDVPFPEHPFLLIILIILSNGIFVLLGTLSGLWANTFDHISGITTFIVTPMGFLGGTFYSIHMLPPIAKALSYSNPFFYFLDAIRWAFFGVSDVSPSISILITTILFLLLFGLTYWAFRINWRLQK
jgi:ABC-2 type transport system permease protein